MDEVHECMTPVFIFAEANDGKLLFFFDIPREAPTVRGFGAILQQGLDGSTREQVGAVPDDFYFQMGLQSVLSGQRLNGIAAILAHMKRVAQGLRLIRSRPRDPLKSYIDFMPPGHTCPMPTFV